MTPTRPRTLPLGATATRAFLLGLALACSCCVAPASAQTPPDRWITALEIRQDGDAWTVELGFAAPLLVMGHSPRDEGRLVEISVAPVQARDRSRDVFAHDENVAPPRDTLAPLRGVKLEPQGSGQALVVLTFADDVHFDVLAPSGGRSIVLRLTPLRARAPRTGPASGAAGSDVGPIMEEAERAMVAHEYPRAVALYTKVLGMQGGKDLAEAQEYLGLAYQKNGQRAHARAEYELYLLRFPDTEGAARVRQRLDALLSSARSDREPLRAVRDSNPVVFDAYGFVSTSYQRAESYGDLSGAVMLDSSQIVDFDVTGLMRGRRFDARARGSGYYRYDFLDSETGRGSQIRYLTLELRDRALRLRGLIGRQTAGGSGILSRYDGMSVSWDFLDKFYLGAAFGFPQDYATSNSFDTRRGFVGGRIGVDGWHDQFSGEIWCVAQKIDDMVDRIAIGYELRWVGRLGSAFSALDYDAYHQSLNLAMASGSVELIEGTSLNLMADYRRSPYLTTRSALIGQPVGTIDALRDLFSPAAIEYLAHIRTSTSATFVLGLDQQLGARWRVLGDVTATTLSGTLAGGGVPATPDTGWQFFYTAQLIGVDQLIEGDTQRVALRVYDGFRYMSYAIGGSSRIPVWRSFWLGPRIDLDFRDQEEVRNRLAIRPGLRAEIDFRHVRLETNVQMEWLKSVGSGIPQPSSDALGYLLDVTLSLDF